MQNILTTIRRVAVLAGLAFTAACSTDVTGPNARPVAPDGPQAEIISAEIGQVVDGLREFIGTAVLERSVALSADITVTKTIGKSGGAIAIPGAGFELVVPKGAVTKNTTFTVTALAGKAIAYEFGPHGATFRMPLIFRQNSLHTVGWWNATAGGYFKSRDQVDTQNNKATVDEALGLIWDGSWMTMQIHHFSGYLVSCA